MVGSGIEKDMEPSRLCDGLNMGSEERERSRCWCLGVETEYLGEWGRWRGRETQGLSLKPLTFAMTGLVFRG